MNSEYQTPHPDPLTAVSRANKLQEKKQHKKQATTLYSLIAS